MLSVCIVSLQSSINTLKKEFPEKVATTISAHPCMQLSHQLGKISTAVSPFSERLLPSRSISPWPSHRLLWRNSSGLTPTFHAYPCRGRGSETVNWLSSRMKTSFLWLTRCSHIGKPKSFFFLFHLENLKKKKKFLWKPLQSRKSVHLGSTLRLYFFLMVTNKMKKFCWNEKSSQLPDDNI